MDLGDAGQVDWSQASIDEVGVKSKRWLDRTHWKSLGSARAGSTKRSRLPGGAPLLFKRLGLFVASLILLTGGSLAIAARAEAAVAGTTHSIPGGALIRNTA
jgi:hypothetical protein